MSGPQSWTQVGSHKSGVEAENPLPQPAGHNALDAAQHTGAHCWLMVSFPSPNTPKSFSLGLLSIPSSPSLDLCLGLPRPMGGTLHLALLSFMRIAQTHLSSLSRSLSMAHPFPPACHGPTQLGVISELAEGASIPLSVSPTKMLNSAGSNTNP